MEKVTKKIDFGFDKNTQDTNLEDRYLSYIFH